MDVDQVTVSLVRQVDESYPVFIGRGLVPRLVARLAEPDLAARRIAVLTDSTVRPLLADAIAADLTQAGRQVQVFEFEAGENHKSRQTKAELEDAMIAAGYGRDSVVVAVGGGVVTDLAGFVAATYTRGIPVVHVPTTTLAAADASVGGKTGVDTEAATNLIGAFHQPASIFIDLDLWRTLPESEVQTGLAETIKHALIADATLFERLEEFFVTQGRSAAALLADDYLVRYVARRNVEIKRDFVTADVHEAGVRMVVNLGHTYGRALEAAMNFQITHGAAVAVGLAMQARWGVRLGYQSAADAERLLRLLTVVGLPTQVPDSVTDAALLHKMTFDKKVRGGVIQFVYAHGVGDYQRFAADGRPDQSGTQVARPVPHEDIAKVLPDIRS